MVFVLKREIEQATSHMLTVPSYIRARRSLNAVKLDVTTFLAVEHADRDTGVFADAERVKLLRAESFKLASMICIYGGFFG